MPTYYIGKILFLFFWRTLYNSLCVGGVEYDTHTISPSLPLPLPNPVNGSGNQATPNILTSHSPDSALDP